MPEFALDILYYNFLNGEQLSIPKTITLDCLLDDELISVSGDPDAPADTRAGLPRSARELCAAYVASFVQTSGEESATDEFAGKGSGYQRDIFPNVLLLSIRESIAVRGERLKEVKKKILAARRRAAKLGNRNRGKGMLDD